MTDKTKMLQRKAAWAANRAMLCLDKLEDKTTPYGEYKELLEAAREYQRQAKFLSACARQEMGVA